jgi:aminoglycoside phosphotransferase (APT) family kinase protein
MTENSTYPEFRDVAQALTEMGLLRDGEQFAIAKLSGGVSCDVWRVELERGPVCVKRALAKLRVAANWYAPAERAETEVAWFRLAASVDPKCVPAILGEDRARHMFAMTYFPPDEYPVWKANLAAGNVDVNFAARVGRAIASIHAATAGRTDIAAQFDHSAQFHALRIEPYLLFTAERHPDLAPRIRALAESVANARIALMHGDVSPKNILCGPDGPIFLDAETACTGDPAFDLAFCLNHLLLKCVWHPQYSNAYLDSFAALKDTYLKCVTWERPDVIGRRAAGLLSALLLARIDGKSPVEYLMEERDKAFVRKTAKYFLASELTLTELLEGWRGVISIR